MRLEIEKEALKQEAAKPGNVNRKAKTRVKQIDKEIAELKEKATDAERRLPQTKSVPDILVTVAKIAKKNNILVLGFTPGAMGSKPFFFELNYPLRIKGTCHSIGKFLAGLALEERIFNVMNMVFGTASPDGIMEVNFTLLSYQYKKP
jgi:Tfp pilus assembly protein PilO